MSLLSAYLFYYTNNWLLSQKFLGKNVYAYKNEVSQKDKCNTFAEAENAMMELCIFCRDVVDFKNYISIY